MWFKMGGQRIEEVVAEAPPVPAIGGEHAIVDTGLGGGFPARPTETPAADMARDLQANLVNSAIVESATALPDLSPAPIGAADRSSVDALNTAAQGFQGEIAARQNPAVQVDLTPGSNFGNNIIDATGSASTADKRPWAGGRRPKGAVVSDASSGIVSDTSDAVGSETPVGSLAPEGLSAGVPAEGVVNGEGSVMGDAATVVEGESAGAAVAAEVASQITGADSGNPAEAPTVEVTTGGVGDNDGTSGDPGVAVPPPGETYPSMQPPMPNMWTKPAGDTVINPNPDAGVTTPAPRELTQEEKDAQIDNAEDATEREKIIKEGLGDANSESVSPNAGDQIEPSNTAARDSVLTSEVTDQLRTDGVIKTEDGSEVIDATNISPADEVVPVAEETPATEPAPTTDEVVTEAPVIVAGTTDSDGDGVSDPSESVLQPPVVETSGSDVAPDVTRVDVSAEDETQSSADGGDSAIEETVEASEPAIQDEASAQEAVGATSVVEGDRDLQERADELVGKPIREAVDVLKNTDLNERQALIEELASAVVFKQIESEGISNVIDVKDPNGLADRINGMAKLFELWVKESQSRISNVTSDEKVVPVEEPEAPSAQSVPADTTQAA